MLHFLPDMPLMDVAGKMSEAWILAVSIANPRMTHQQVYDLWVKEAEKHNNEIDIAVGLKWPAQYPEPEPEFLVNKTHLLLKQMPPIARMVLTHEERRMLDNAGYFK